MPRKKTKSSAAAKAAPECNKICSVPQPTKYEFLNSVENEIQFLTKNLQCDRDQLFESLVFYLLAKGPTLMGGSLSLVRPMLEEIRKRR